MFTIWNWILFAGIVVCCAGIGLSVGTYDDKEGMGCIVGAAAGVLLGVVIMAIIGWYHTNTASGIRDMKDYHSELSNGIEREIIITAEDGREIFRYEGKVDVESNHEDNYIKFESEEGKRYIVYYGIQDTITIIEK